MLIHYTESTNALWQLFFVVILVAVGNGLFQPSSSSLLTSIAKSRQINLGVVMGAQESVSSFARIIGTLTGGIVWTVTVDREWPLDYHTSFHICGILMIMAAILSLKLQNDEQSANDNFTELQ